MLLSIDWTRRTVRGKPIMCRAKSGRVKAKASPTFNDEVKWITKYEHSIETGYMQSGSDNTHIYYDLPSNS